MKFKAARASIHFCINLWTFHSNQFCKLRGSLCFFRMILQLISFLFLAWVSKSFEAVLNQTWGHTTCLQRQQFVQRSALLTNLDGTVTNGKHLSENWLHRLHWVCVYCFASSHLQYLVCLSWLRPVYAAARINTLLAFHSKQEEL